MSKKEKLPSTPESREAKRVRNAEKRQIFGKTFEKALAIALSLVLVVSVTYIAFHPATSAPAVNAPSAPVVAPSTPAAPSAPAAPSTGDSAQADAPADKTEAPKEITNDSSMAEKLAYFNTAINNVKPNAKTVTVVKETNSQAGSIEGTIPKTLVSIANSLIKSNMGDVKDIPAPATSEADKNKVFPVENETYASQLTEADVKNITVSEADGKYTIVVEVKDDELSATTAHGQGHAGKAFSVITPATTIENAGGAAKMLKNVQTAHKDNKITVTVDKATGNVLTADYHFVWTLYLEVLGQKIQIPFGLDKSIKIDW